MAGTSPPALKPLTAAATLGEVTAPFTALAVFVAEVPS